MPNYSKLVSNLVQGVSQQAASQRRDAQCEIQYDCINSPRDGAVSRPASEVIKFISGVDYRNAFFYEILRGNNERYLVVIQNGDLKVYDTSDGTECTVTFAAPKTYLTLAAGLTSRLNFCAQTVNDVTFIGNKTTTMVMAATTAPTRPPEALVFFRAGAYLMTFAITITYQGTAYTWTYQTPDNSTASNAAYITSNQIAATFFRALTGAAATPNTTATGDAGTHGVGPINAGQTTGVAGSVTATSLGFSVAIDGNVIRIWRASDTNAFDIDTTDGAGDTYILAFKDTTSLPDDLPRTGFQDFTLKVEGANQNANTAYYVKYSADKSSSGLWEETTQPGVVTNLDATTMPHALTNTGFRTFTWDVAPWAPRVVGDLTVDPNPYFVGETIEDISFAFSRLVIICEGFVTWSKAKNPYVFFQDTVQTALDTAVINEDVAGADYIPLLRFAVAIDQALFLWAQRQQLGVSSGQDPFRATSIIILPSTGYEFAEQVRPIKIAQSLYFANEVGNWASLMSLPFYLGRPMEAASLTDHVSSYVPSGLHRYTASRSLQTQLFLTDGAPNNAYVYNELKTGSEIVQSAWNTWRFPSQVLWASIFHNSLTMLVHRDDGAILLNIDMTPDVVDADTGAGYQTRLDLRLKDTDCTLSYSTATGQTTITLPFDCPDYSTSNALVVARTDGADRTRGTIFDVISVGTNTLVVNGDITQYKLYIGLRISAQRTESRFFVRGQNGPVLMDDLTVLKYRSGYAKTGYTRIEVSDSSGTLKGSYEYSGRVLGTSSSMTGTPSLSEGELDADVGMSNEEAIVTLLNDSFLKSCWTSAKWDYSGVMRTPMQPGQ